MKPLLFYIAPLALISCQFSSDNIKNLNDLEAANLKGNVVRVKEIYHKVGDVCCPAGDKSECSLKITSYDSKGYTIETAKVGIAGDTIMKSRHIYNNFGECTTVENLNGSRLLSREINNVDKGFVKAVHITDEKGFVLNKHLFGYRKGLLTHGKTWNGEGKLLNSFINKYNEGKVETEIVRDSEGNVFSITRHERNHQGDIARSTITHPRDSSEFTLNFEYVYDKSGNWVKQTKIYNDDIISIKIRDIEYFADK